MYTTDLASAPTLPAGLLLALLASALVPGLIAYNFAPSPTLLNQAAGLGLWGAALAVLARTRLGGLRAAVTRSSALQIALGLVAISALLSSALSVLPWAMSVAAAGLSIASMLLAIGGAAVRPTSAQIGRAHV